MQKITEMKFFSLIKNSVYNYELNPHNIQDAYEEFISFLIQSSFDNSHINFFYNQLKYAKIELTLLKKKGLNGDKKKTTHKKYIKKAIYFIDAQLELIKWKTMSGGYEFNSNTINRKKSKNSKLQWTGSIVELVEFAYAALECKSFNNGDLEIKELTALLSEYFNINVKDCYRVFVDIRHRTGDQTIYIDKLKYRMMEKLEKMDNKDR